MRKATMLTRRWVADVFGVPEHLLRKGTPEHVVRTGDRVSPAQLREAVAQKKRHKYGAKKQVIDGISFPSKREARRYAELAALVRAGEVLNLELQPRWDLHAVGGTRVCAYVADFRYIVAATGETVVEDVKGVKTPVYRLKKKWLKAEHRIAVREV